MAEFKLNSEFIPIVLSMTNSMQAIGCLQYFLPTQDVCVIFIRIYGIGGYSTLLQVDRLWGSDNRYLHYAIILIHIYLFVFLCLSATCMQGLLGNSFWQMISYQVFYTVYLIIDLNVKFLLCSERTYFTRNLYHLYINIFIHKPPTRYDFKNYI